MRQEIHSPADGGDGLARALATTAVLFGIILAISPPARDQVLAAPAGARQFAASVMSGRALGAANDILRPGSGEQDLPPTVLDMLALVRGSGIQTFSLSPQIAANDLWLQRLTESAFPRRIAVQARTRLVRAGEGLARGCYAVAMRHGVVLARCL